jgi:hypothetical protein
VQRSGDPVIGSSGDGKCKIRGRGRKGKSSNLGVAAQRSRSLTFAHEIRTDRRCWSCFGSG